MIKILKSKDELTTFINKCKKQNKTIGFAPTMGALHEGHLSLYKKAKQENNVIISSIFVNPTQFNNQEDLDKYPRNIVGDIAILEKSNKVDAVYIPKVEDIYPNGIRSKNYDFGGIENEMEGAFRPGHFDGVGTVVEELLRQIKPNNAYFGEKDFQQLAIIKKLIKITNLNTSIHGVPIYRAESGLAMSSRNQRLTSDQKDSAKIIYKTLLKVKEWFKTLHLSDIKEKVETIFKNQNEMELEYFIIADEDNLKETHHFEKGKKYRAFIVVYVGKVRLIDNIAM